MINNVKVINEIVDKISGTYDDANYCIKLHKVLTNEEIDKCDDEIGKKYKTCKECIIAVFKNDIGKYVKDKIIKDRFKPVICPKCNTEIVVDVGIMDEVDKALDKIASA